MLKELLLTIDFNKEKPEFHSFTMRCTEGLFLSSSRVELELRARSSKCVTHFGWAVFGPHHKVRRYADCTGIELFKLRINQ